MRLSAKAILNSALGMSVENNALIESVVAGAPVKGLAAIKISPTIPIVAVGGPARVYYGEVAKRLDCEVVFVEWCEVANAIGAAAGLVALKVTVMVEGDGNGAFRVHGGQGTRIFGSGAEALSFAQTTAHDQAESMALGCRRCFAEDKRGYQRSIICPMRWMTMACSRPRSRPRPLGGLPRVS